MGTFAGVTETHSPAPAGAAAGAASLSAAPLMVSISGVRGLVGRSMTPIVAAEFAAALGATVRESTGVAQPTICLGRDSRPSGESLALAAMGALLAAGCKVIDLGIVATPTVGVMIGEHAADGGLVITASHNPIEWNGMKALNADGVAPPFEDAQRLIARFESRDFAFVGPTDAGIMEGDETGPEQHATKVITNIDARNARRGKFRVVLDSVHGAGGGAACLLLEALDCEVVHLYAEPTGLFPHSPEPLAENLRELAQRTAQEGAAIGFAQDPDADRLAIVDETGRFIGEEYTLALAVQRMLERSAASGAPGAPGTPGTPGVRVLAANLSTSRMIDDIAARFPGSRVIRTPVGEAHVAAALKAERGLIGGEGNGGVIFPPVTWVRDSLSAMALTLSLMADHHQRLSALVDALPRYHMIKRKFDLTSVGGRDAVPVLLDRVANHFRNERVIDIDGVRVDFADGWVHLRPSNTEPIVRLIAEAATVERAEALIAQAAQAAGIAS